MEFQVFLYLFVALLFGISNASTTTSASIRTAANCDSKTALLKKYAPYHYMHSSEEFFGSNVQQAFSDYKRVKDSDGTHRLNTKFTMTSPTDYYPIYYGDISKATTYAFVMDKGSGIVDLVYFFWYPFNHGQKLNIINTIFGNHVGDWEHVTVRMVNDVATKVYFGHHTEGSGEVVEWSSVTTYNSTHPVAYVASGSHGHWSSAGSHHYATAGLQKLYDKCDSGTPVRTWERLEAYDYNNKVRCDAGSDDASWPAWLSTDYTSDGTGDATVPGNGGLAHWGNSAAFGVWVFGTTYYRLEDGPTGPEAKSKIWDTTLFA